MSDRIELAREAYRLAMRHFHSSIESMSHRDDTVNPADPTHRRTTAGWVTFDYDPFLPLAEIDGDLHPQMLTTWHLAVESMWGDRVVLTLEAVEGDDSVKGTVMIDFYLDDTFVWDPTQSWCQHLDRLLTGSFHSEHPGDWSLEIREPEPDR